jgi:hypothetical protein
MRFPGATEADRARARLAAVPLLRDVVRVLEAYPITDRISWAHPENKYSNHVFADEVRNIDTFNEEYIGRVAVKENKRSGCQGGAALILCLRAGQIALGAPRPKMKSNGELTLCDNLNLVDAAARRALHGNTIHKQVTTRASTGRTARTAGRPTVRRGRQADRPPAARGHREPTRDGVLALRAHLDRGAEGVPRSLRGLHVLLQLHRASPRGRGPALAHTHVVIYLGLPYRGKCHYLVHPPTMGLHFLEDIAEWLRIVGADDRLPKRQPKGWAGSQRFWHSCPTTASRQLSSYTPRHIQGSILLTPTTT